MYNYKEESQQVTRQCEADGCAGPGAYRAPKSRAERPDYFWFCLEHVRDYNRQWNYFDGMDGEEIERFQKDASMGHRPTWNFHVPPHYNESIRAQVHAFRTGQELPPRPAAAHAHLPKPCRKALALMELDYPVTLKEIKKRYKELVKRWHPDVNPGDPAAEERFKQLAVSYRALCEHVRNEVE